MILFGIFAVVFLVLLIKALFETAYGVVLIVAGAALIVIGSTLECFGALFSTTKKSLFA